MQKDIKVDKDVYSKRDTDYFEIDVIAIVGHRWRHKARVDSHSQSYTVGSAEPAQASQSNWNWNTTASFR